MSSRSSECSSCRPASDCSPIQICCAQNPPRSRRQFWEAPFSPSLSQRSRPNASLGWRRASGSQETERPWMSPFDPVAWHRIELVPAVGVGATIAAYVIAVRLQRWSGGSAIFNPTLIAILLLAFAVKLSGMDYADYARSAGVVTFALSPAVALLAVPLFRQRRLIRDSARIIVGALAAGPPAGGRRRTCGG